MFALKIFEKKIKDGQLSENYITYLDRYKKENNIYQKINEIIEKDCNWDWEKYGMPHIINTKGEVYYTIPLLKNKFKIEKSFNEFMVRGQKTFYSANKDIFAIYFKINLFEILKKTDIKLLNEIKKININEKKLYAVGIDYTNYGIESVKAYIDVKKTDKKIINFLDYSIQDIKENHKIKRDLSLIGLNKDLQFAYYFK